MGYAKVYTAKQTFPDVQFSFEVPTQRRYRQTGQGFSVAHFDMALWQKSCKWVNMEFKVNQVSEENLKKDLEKLLVEKESGFFYHYLTKATSQHMRGIRKITKKLHEILAHGNTDNDVMGVSTMSKALRSYPSCLHFYLYELNAHCLYQIQFDNQTKIKSEEDIWKICKKFEL